MLSYPRFLIERFLRYDLILILLSRIPPRLVQKGRREIRKFDALNCWKREGVVVGVVVEVGAHNDCRFPNTASSPSWMKKRGILATIGGLGRTSRVRSCRHRNLIIDRCPLRNLSLPLAMYFSIYH